jgi:MYXO-CTERM domain-containing protein
MKSIIQILAIGATALFTTTFAVQANPVLLNWSSTYEGLATPTQDPLGTGVIEIGWLNAGTTEAMIDALYAAGDLNGIDAIFNTVSILSFSPGSPNSADGLGVPFESFTLVSDHVTDAEGFNAYKANLSGKQVYAWLRDSAGVETTSLMAFIDAGVPFAAALDTVFFSDFETNGATDSFAIGSSNVWVGSLAPVVVGSGIDNNPGDGQINNDGLTLGGGDKTLQLATVVPEPGTATFALLGLAGLAARRHRNKVA